jgi:hypothetical protein
MDSEVGGKRLVTCRHLVKRTCFFSETFWILWRLDWSRLASRLAPSSAPGRGRVAEALQCVRLTPGSVAGHEPP